MLAKCRGVCCFQLRHSRVLAGWLVTSSWDGVGRDLRGWPGPARGWASGPWGRRAFGAEEGIRPVAPDG